MAEPDVFELADRALARVVTRIAPDQWDMTLPASFTTRSRPEPPSLRAHRRTTTRTTTHGYPTCWRDAPWTRRAGRSSTADLLGDDPAASFESIVEPLPARRPQR